MKTIDHLINIRIDIFQFEFSIIDLSFKITITGKKAIINNLRCSIHIEDLIRIVVSTGYHF